MPSPSGPPATVCPVLHTLKVGGAEVLAARLARRLGGRFRFVFACLEEAGALGEQLRDEGFRVAVIGRGEGLDGRCPLRLARFFRAEGVALVHAHQYTPFFYSAAARLLYRRPPILFTEHGRHFPDYPRRKRKLANRLLLRRRDRVVAVGGAVRKALIDNEGIPAARVRVVYNGIDTDRFAPSAAADREDARRELGLAPGDFAVLQVARLDYLKDHPTAVRAVGRVAGVLPGTRLLLAGEGPELEKVRAEVEKRNLGDVVRFLGLRRDVPRLYAAADLFLLTSISEGIPLTAIEAMAAGLPVVATDVGGMAEVVADGETGLLAPAGDDAALADHILRLAGDALLRREMGGRGRRRAQEVFCEGRMVEEYAGLYREMLRV